MYCVYAFIIFIYIIYILGKYCGYPIKYCISVIYDNKKLIVPIHLVNRFIYLVYNIYIYGIHEHHYIYRHWFIVSYQRVKHIISLWLLYYISVDTVFQYTYISYNTDREVWSISGVGPVWYCCNFYNNHC